MKVFNEDVLGNILAGEALDKLYDKYPVDKPSLLLNENYRFSQTLSADQIEKEVDALLGQYTSLLTRHAAVITWDKSTISDGIQETFLRYFIARIGGKRIENPRAWLFRVLTNYILDCNRKSSSMPALKLEAAAQFADSRQDIESGYQRSEAFRRALLSLSPREQECMHLWLEGFAYEEIAQMLKIRPGTVGALLARGLKKIREAGLFSRRQQ
jgi:RNA polymerase sigma factor (sigma-70 family)